MTLSTTTQRNRYEGADSTATFAYTFKIFSEDQLTVYVRNTTSDVITLLTLTTDYTVDSIGDNSGGNIVLQGTGKSWQGTGSNLDDGYDIYILRVVGLDQDTELRNTGAFYPETHEDKFDYLTMIDQQQNDQFDRVPMVDAATDTSTFTNNIGVPQADKYLAINSGGTGYELRAGTVSSVSAVIENAYMDGYTSLNGDNFILFKTTRQDNGSALIELETDVDYTRVRALAPCTVIASGGGIGAGSSNEIEVRVYNSSDVLQVTSGQQSTNATKTKSASLSYKLATGDYVVVYGSAAQSDTQECMFSVVALTNGL